jgi:hypothetical protein
MNTTCQICGRQIKANTGLIAHHGYQRPGQGWQTASCFGARWRPYEVACDALPPAITSISDYIAMREKAFAELIASPPEVLTFEKGTWNWKRGAHDKETVTVTRPEGFTDATRDDFDRHMPHTYGGEYRAKRAGIEHDIKSSQHTLAELRKRLKNWVAPAEARAS